MVWGFGFRSQTWTSNKDGDRRGLRGKVWIELFSASLKRDALETLEGPATSGYTPIVAACADSEKTLDFPTSVFISKP